MNRLHPVVAIPDIHGDREAAEYSLHHAGIISDPSTSVWEIQQEARDTVIILLGDLCDRGEETLQVFDLIQRLRNEKMMVEVLAGNHDLLAMAGLAHYSEEARHTWLKTKNGGTKFHNEITAAMGNENTRPLKKQSEEMTQFLREQYGDIFSSMKMCHQQDDIFFGHSGSIKGKWRTVLKKKGVDGANALFQEMTSDDNLHSASFLELLYGSDQRGWAPPFWARKKNAHSPLITPASADVFEQLGVHAVVHGHHAKTTCPLLEYEKHGSRRYPIINMDAAISRRMPQDSMNEPWEELKGGWAYLKIERNGRIHAKNDLGNTVDFMLES